MPGRGIRSLQGSLSITKIPRPPKRPDISNLSTKMDPNSDDDTHILDSEDESTRTDDKSRTPPSEANTSEDKTKNPSDSTENENSNDSAKQNKNEPLILTTDEKLPSEEALERKSIEENSVDFSRSRGSSLEPPTENANSLQTDRIEKKINLLKNYRHQRPGNRPQTESSLSQLERTASVLNKESMPDFRRNLDDITQSYSPTNEEKSVKSKKKKSPNKTEGSESQDKQPSMSHSVSSMLGNARKSDIAQMVPVAPIENSGHTRPPRGLSESPMGVPPTPKPSHLSLDSSHGTLLTAGSPTPAGADLKVPVPHPSSVVHPMAASSQAYPGANPPPEGYGQYPPGIYFC